MALMTKPSSPAGAALAFVTIGSLLIVWMGLTLGWCYMKPEGVTDKGWFLYIGFLLTGVTFLVIGLAVGQIGRAARKAELPPAEVTPAVAKTDQQAAQTGQVAPPAPMAPTPPAAPMAPMGQAAYPQMAMGPAAAPVAPVAPAPVQPPPAPRR